MLMQVMDEVISLSGDGGVSFVSGGGGGSVTTASIEQPSPAHPLESKTEQYIMRAQSFDISANGLRPLTQHFFFYEGTNATDRCKPLGGEKGDGLITDRNGALSFTVFVDATTIVPTTGYEQAESIATAFATTRRVRITNAIDGSQQDSYCDSVIGFNTTQEVVITDLGATVQTPEVPVLTSGRGRGGDGSGPD